MRRQRNENGTESSTNQDIWKHKEIEGKKAEERETICMSIKG